MPRLLFPSPSLGRGNADFCRNAPARHLSAGSQTARAIRLQAVPVEDRKMDAHANLPRPPQISSHTTLVAGSLLFALIRIVRVIPHRNIVKVQKKWVALVKWTPQAHALRLQIVPQPVPRAPIPAARDPRTVEVAQRHFVPLHPFTLALVMWTPQTQRPNSVPRASLALTTAVKVQLTSENVAVHLSPVACVRAVRIVPRTCLNAMIPSVTGCPMKTP